METTNGMSAADMAAIMNNQGANSWSNNPFMYLIWLAWMGNNGGLFGGGNAQGQQNIETNAKLNQLSQNATLIAALKTT